MQNPHKSKKTQLVFLATPLLSPIDLRIVCLYLKRMNTSLKTISNSYANFACMGTLINVPIIFSFNFASTLLLRLNVNDFVRIF